MGVSAVTGRKRAYRRMTPGQAAAGAGLELMGFWGKIVIGVGPREKRGIRTQAMARAMEFHHPSWSSATGAENSAAGVFRAKASPPTVPIWNTGTPMV